MAEFLPAVTITLQHEGGFVDNPADKGGPTNMGITQRDVPTIYIKELTVAQAQNFYFNKFWNSLFVDIESQDIANKIFDMGVLFGVSTATRLAWDIFHVTGSDIFNSNLVRAINQTAAFLSLYKGRLLKHARWIPTQDASQEEFLDGWINRIQS